MLLIFILIVYLVNCADELIHEYIFQDCIYKIKESFNFAFQEVYRSKVSELKRIREKNVRVKKILNDLSLNEFVFEPVMDNEECPETLLYVKDEEVPFERYVTEEEKVRIEQENKKNEGAVNIINI